MTELTDVSKMDAVRALIHAAYTCLDQADALCDDAFIRQHQDLAIGINVEMQNTEDLLDSIDTEVGL